MNVLCPERWRRDLYLNNVWDDLKINCFEFFTDRTYNTLKTTNSFCKLIISWAVTDIASKNVRFFKIKLQHRILSVSSLGKALKAHPVSAPNGIWGSNKCSVSWAPKAQSVFKIMFEMFWRLIVLNSLRIVPTTLPKQRIRFVNREFHSRPLRILPLAIPVNWNLNGWYYFGIVSEKRWRRAQYQP